MAACWAIETYAGLASLLTSGVRLDNPIPTRAAENSCIHAFVKTDSSVEPGWVIGWSSVSQYFSKTWEYAAGK
jgi:hypothetical protein